VPSAQEEDAEVKRGARRIRPPSNTSVIKQRGF